MIRALTFSLLMLFAAPALAGDGQYSVGVTECIMQRIYQMLGRKSVVLEVFESHQQELQAIFKELDISKNDPLISNYRFATREFFSKPPSLRDNYQRKMNALEPLIVQKYGALKGSEMIGHIKRQGASTGFESALNMFRGHADKIHADVLLGAFEKFAEVSGLRTQRIITAAGMPAIEILLPEGKSNYPIEEYLRTLKFGLEGRRVTFCPEELRNENAALYDPSGKRVSLSLEEAHTLVPLGEAAHEFEHAFQEYLLDKGVSSLFHGGLAVEHQSTAGPVRTGYARFQSLDEPSAFAVTLGQLREELKQVGPIQFNGETGKFYSKKIEFRAKAGVEVSDRNFKAADKALEVLSDPLVQLDLKKFEATSQSVSYYELNLDLGELGKLNLPRSSATELALVNRWLNEGDSVARAELITKLKNHFTELKNISELMKTQFIKVQEAANRSENGIRDKKAYSYLVDHLVDPRRISLRAIGQDVDSVNPETVNIIRFTRDWFKHQ